MSTASPTHHAPDDIQAFHRLLSKSSRILALCGAGLSAASGLPTFRGAGGLWRNHQATQLATPQAFRADPGLVWQFYAYRRHLALKAEPNAGHWALAALAREMKGGGGEGQGQRGFMCLTQNVDGLHARAGHPPEQLRMLHGSLFDVKCDNRRCGWVQRGNYDDPFCEALEVAAEEDVTTGNATGAKIVRVEDLPRCPLCKKGLQRPGVVWFGENLDEEMLADVDAWIAAGDVDMVLVVGTAAVVHPAASYVELARGPKTIVVTVNIEAETPRSGRDFAFQGDAAELLPRLLEPVIGNMRGDGTLK